MDGTSGNPGADLKIGEEYPPAGEDEAISNLRTLHLKVHKISPGSTLRGEHPKQHGGLWGTFEVAHDIPPEFKVGIFQEPLSLKAFIRFSNGRSFDDRDPNIRGMAIKVFVSDNSEGACSTQDFILADHPIFFARDVQQIYDFLVASSTGTAPDKLVKMFPKLAGYTKIAKDGPLQLSYWSQTPYQLGTHAVKYLASPSSEQDKKQPELTLADAENCLREAMIEQLVRQRIGVKFDFSIIPQTDAYVMPVEDPTIEWTSEPVRLATISIHPQAFDSQEQMSLAETSVWSPWHFLPQHRPLGGINRARRLIYSESQDLRHAHRV